MFQIFKASKDQIISKIVRKYKDSEIFELEVPYNNETFNNRFMFYTSDNEFIKSIESKLKSKKISFLKNDSIMIISGESKVLFLIVNYDGIIDCIDFIDLHLKNDHRTKMTDIHLKMIKFEMERLLSFNNSTLNELKKEFNDISFSKGSVTINTLITPDFVLYKDKTYRLSPDISEPITSIKIYITPDNKITRVKISGEHPNADENGWYCLGFLKFAPLTVMFIQKLIDNMKLYNLTDCYNNRLTKLVKKNILKGELYH